MNSPVVSIIMRSYNRAHCLDRAIDSILSQTFTDWELIVVDNSSIDHTDEVVYSYVDHRIRLLKIQNHGIIAASFNLGLSHAAGQYIAILDSDDWWSPDKLALSIESLQDGADLVYHDMTQLSFKGKQLVSRQVFRSKRLRPPVFTSLLLNGNLIPCSSVVARRSLLLELGGFSEDPSILGAEDYEAWLRLSRITDRFVRVEGPVLYYTWNSGNLSSDRLSIAFCHGLSRIYRKQLSDHHLVHPSWMLVLLIKAYWCERKVAGIPSTLRVISSLLFSDFRSLFFHPRSMLSFVASLGSQLFTVFLSRCERRASFLLR